MVEYEKKGILNADMLVGKIFKKIQKFDTGNKS